MVNLSVKNTVFPSRKPMRLAEYDYSSARAYFVTVCVDKKKPLLWEDVGANWVRPQGLPLSSIGKVVDAEIRKISSVYSAVSVDKYCIMPDHIHMILSICATDGG